LSFQFVRMVGEKFAGVFSTGATNGREVRPIVDNGMMIVRREPPVIAIADGSRRPHLEVAAQQRDPDSSDPPESRLTYY
jgi:hypothetical protein